MNGYPLILKHHALLFHLEIASSSRNDAQVVRDDSAYAFSQK